MVQCYSCERDGVFFNKGTPFKLCSRCNQYYYQHPRARPTKHYDKFERNKANSIRNKVRHLTKWGITSRECYDCGKITRTNNRGEEMWKYNLNSGKVIGMLCGHCERNLYPAPRDLLRKEEQRWKRAVMKRDNYTCRMCRMCGLIGIKRISHVRYFKHYGKYVYPNATKKVKYIVGVGAHHIKSFTKHPLLRFDINNGIAICKECHKKEHRK